MADKKGICDGTVPMIVGGSDGGILLPLGGEWEGGWPGPLKAILYLTGLLWCFMGVSIIADIFMAAIEKITSSRKRTWNKRANKNITIKVWNNTIANLSLMALGSSAPEILLSVIELTISNQMHSGDLGPSTIVGSAAFNLLCISAVCVAALPEGEVRMIKDTGVFAVTAFFSVFAYVWLIVILVVISPDVVEVWEGALTFFFFPALLGIAYGADIGALPGMSKPEPPSTVHAESTKEELAEMELNIRHKYGKNSNLDAEKVAALMAYEYSQPPSRASNRIAATRMMVGGKGVALEETPWMKGKRLSSELAKLVSVHTVGDDKPHVGFNALNYTILESHGTLQVFVERSGGRLEEKLTVKYNTVDGSAKKGSDYQAKSGVLEFLPGNEPSSCIKPIDIEIVKSDEHEETEEFYVELSDAKIGENEVVKLDPRSSKVTVVIIDEDSPGVLKFEMEDMTVGSQPADGDAAKAEDVKVEDTHDFNTSTQNKRVEVKVVRVKGSSGEVKCKWNTEDGSAIKGKDYIEAEGELVFKQGQMSASFYVEVLPNGKYEAKDEMFRVLLTEADGTTFDNTTDGGGEKCILSVTISGDKSHQARIDKVFSVFMNMDRMEVGSNNWKTQFLDAVYVNGDPEHWREAGVGDWIFHIAGLPWKVLFAFVPPTDFLGGWLCFVCALGMIGIVTAIIGDMASLLGCCVGMCDSITAITFVALGTSLPDTFASKAAAVNEEYADNCIGNITGSNSVNVFLGLGLPWFIGAIYWEIQKAGGPTDDWMARHAEKNWGELDILSRYPNGAFVVKSGALGISVALFTVCACICIGTLFFRRQRIGGELGGTKQGQYMTAAFFVFLWVLYIVGSWQIGGC